MENGVCDDTYLIGAFGTIFKVLLKRLEEWKPSRLHYFKDWPEYWVES